MPVLHPLCDHGRLPADCESCRIEIRRGTAHLLDTCRHGRLMGQCDDCTTRDAVLERESVDSGGTPTATGRDGADRPTNSVGPYRVELRLTGPDFTVEVDADNLPTLVPDSITALLDDLCDAVRPHASQDEGDRGGTRGADGAVPPPVTVTSSTEATT